MSGRRGCPTGGSGRALPLRSLEWLNSNGLRVAAYTLASAAALLAWSREARRGERVEVWPAFWLITAVTLGAMALGRALDLDALVTALGRSQSVAEGWYENRRRAQATVVGTIGVLWAAVVATALWRVPERRRRYLPAALVLFSLLCFAAIRLVSLHQVDAVLYRRDLAGVRIGSLAELAGIVVVIVLSLLVVTRSQARTHESLPAVARSGPDA